MPIVLIGADICPIERNRPFFERGDAESLFHDLLPEFHQADLVIANLECPFIDKPSPIAKTGPVFGESSDCIRGIQKAGIGVLSLANNHILDHGPAGLKHTLETCARAGIATVGAGENIATARRILVRNLPGVRLGILAVAEHEFSIAGKNRWGANPLDIIDFVRNVNDHRSEFDYLVVLLHGGDEFHVPSPRIKNTARFMVEMGANAVIVQHSHCLGGYEHYQGGHIVYGQGALVMDEGVYRNRKTFHEGFLVKLSIKPRGASTMDLIPFVQSDPPPGARKMSGQRAEQFHQELEAKAKLVADDGAVENEWVKFCRQNRHGYMSCLLGHNRVLAKLNSGGLAQKLLYSPIALLRAKNIVACETHREAIETIFDANLLQ